MVQADFEFFDPKPGDFNGVKLLLQNYLDSKPWDLSGFVDLILKQTTVGTIGKSAGHDEEEEGDDDDKGLFAVISALNLGRYAGHRCIMELKQFLLEVCRDESTKIKLKLLLEQQESDVGLLVSQRSVNRPYQLVPPLFDALFDEVSWATEDESPHRSFEIPSVSNAIYCLPESWRTKMSTNARHNIARIRRNLSFI